jgi:DNA repair exonuclease SbcCD ATPase subunit
MRLIKCFIQGFGGLKEVEYSFSPGLNCFVGDNGSGKTTLAAFIRAMLYGIGDTRKQSLDENQRKKHPFRRFFDKIANITKDV